MTYESMEEEIKCFIDNELADMEDYPDCYLKEDIEKNTKFLNDLENKDIESISNMVLDDNKLNEILRETLRYYIYHYNKEKK